MAESKAIDSLWLGADLVTMREGKYHIIKDGALAVTGDRLVWVGPRAEMPDFTPRQQHRFDGGILTPGLIDCHTHLVFGGDRSAEFEQRLNGVSYAEIAAQGGGILSTVRATREASEASLVASARWRLDRLLAEGVTTVEIKSGYGLDEASELRMLSAIRQLGESAPIDVLATCLAAHAFPPEFKQDPDGWVDLICQRILPQVKANGLADAVDAFCEHLAFSPAQVARVFDKAVELGLPVKLHAEQLSSLGGARLAAGYGALSADHLEYATEEGARAMGERGTVAVLLPGAFYLLRETQRPPVALFRQHGVPMALASDANPGTSPALSLRLMLNMGCTLFGMTPEEALAGVTLWGAKALGLQQTHGSLEAGKVANFVHWPLARPAELVYWLGGELPCTVIYRGEAQ
ncbi:MAG: imidazolonepropionase [Pantoea sp.]|uniref:imidazolonepropionase n=1 Tax=Pantoea septica TaxID=472695 RepID=UPI001C12316F|nr:imidazolonepropionase [Pantoea septica]MBU5376954.1 imidazolonepropionase [Pantoea septica]MDU6440218.1 imidazolonepropionase [Pantoea sp.]